MSKMKEMQVLIEEVARIALENPEERYLYSLELGVEEKELDKVYAYLESLLEGESK